MNWRLLSTGGRDKYSALTIVFMRDRPDREHFVNTPKWFDFYF